MTETAITVEPWVRFGRRVGWSAKLGAELLGVFPTKREARDAASRVANLQKTTAERTRRAERMRGAYVIRDGFDNALVSRHRLHSAAKEAMRLRCKRLRHAMVMDGNEGCALLVLKWDHEGTEHPQLRATVTATRPVEVQIWEDVQGASGGRWVTVGRDYLGVPKARKVLAEHAAKPSRRSDDEKK